MALRVRHLQLVLSTEAGAFGAEMRFTDGLNVLAAPNTSGKSTCVMSILYALGLEGMLGPGHSPPLPDAMCRRVMHEGVEYAVIESRVRLEIENGRNEALTVERLVTGTNQARQLIRSISGPALSSPRDDYLRRDFYVRTGGAAQGESGFHRYLAAFIGYELPKVPGAEKEPVPLYLECLFPYFFVDQLTGWRDIKSRMPSYLRIPEMTKRSAEYVLDLDILHRAIERQELLQHEQDMKARWEKELAIAKIELAKSQAVARGIPEEPTTMWPPPSAPQLFATNGVEWLPLKRVLDHLMTRREELVTEEIPRAEEVAQTVIAELRESEEELSQFSNRLDAATRDLMAERGNLNAIYKRLRALIEDNRKYQDAKKLQDRGGELPLKSALRVCPTCHQAIKDVLLEQDKSTSPMTLEDNMAFIRDQIHTFARMREDIEQVIEAKENQVEAILIRITEINAQIRAQKRTLHSDGRVPSAAAVQERLRLDARHLTLQDASEAFAKTLKAFQMMSGEWTELQVRLKTLADVNLSIIDEKKLRLLEESFVAQLRAYNFTSFPVDQLAIGRESYRPSREGYDVGLTSASDTIRIIWAYLLGVLEVDRTIKTNHLGLVVFDEPRQQGAEAPSFDALLKRAAESGNFGQQVIFTTSDDKKLLESILENVECNYIRFTGKIIRPVETKAANEAIVVEEDVPVDDDAGGDGDGHEVPPPNPAGI
jgi:hypothetical protein